MPDDRLDRILREERELVYALGGYGLEFSGGALVTNERLPVPRFNFAQDVHVARDRMAAFFERSLDHYFQRAIRPSFHVADPPPEYLAQALGAYGFGPRRDLLRLFELDRSNEVLTAEGKVEVREANESELDRWVGAWLDTREREELRRFLDVNHHHPNPGEVLRPIVALRDGALVATALLHGFRGNWGLHGIGTQPGRRGAGAATALVAQVGGRFVPNGEPLVLWTEKATAVGHLESLGYREVARYRVFELSPESELHLPPVGPSAGPLWRPGSAPSADLTRR